MFTAYTGLSLVVGDIDYFLPSKLSVLKYTAKINISSAQNQGPIGMNHCAFSAAQDICSKLQNQAKCDSTAFTINLLKFNFSYTFRLLEVTIIARTNYTCYIGHRAQPVYDTSTYCPCVNQVSTFVCLSVPEKRNKLYPTFVPNFKI